MKKIKWIGVVLCLSLFAFMALGSSSASSSDTNNAATTTDISSGTEEA